MENKMKLILVFLLGFLSCAALFYAFSYSYQIPLSIGDFSLVENNANAPSDWIKMSQIEVYDDKIVINVENAGLSRYAPTGSMRPVLDSNSNGILVKPKNANSIKVGDIITFRQGNDLIVHRVIGKGNDDNGTWFETRGDNNALSDGKVYFEDVVYVTIGVLW